MKVLVLGALGFIGRSLAAALQAHGHQVVAAVRPGRGGELPPGCEAIECDLLTDLDPAIWLPRLTGIDAVVNAAGLLKAPIAALEALHHQAPLAVARAAAELGLRGFVQISALGNPADGEFVASKHRGDQALLGCGLPVTVLRPSLVYSLHGSYGGSSLLRALAAAPWLIPVPGRGRQVIQPIHVNDLSALVVAVLERAGPASAPADAAKAEPAGQIWTVVGPELMPLAQFLRGLRRWLRMPDAPLLPVPMAALRLAGWIGDRLGDGPLGSTMVRMVARGNAGTLADCAALQAQFGCIPHSFAWWQAQQPAAVQDRWHARLYPLAPLLRYGLGLTCLLSALAGFAQSPAQISLLAAPLHWPEWLAWIAGYAGSSADAVLGAMLLANWRAQLAGNLLLALVLVYTVVLGFALPGLWLDPWGALAKNLTILPAIAVWRVLAERR
jgi:uncharacterized protein YbjT (DUF2867 family)